MTAAKQTIARWAPGLAGLLAARPADLVADLRAGIAVAAVAVPVGVAYAQLAGFPPEVGLYSSLFPLIVYALLGSSRQLILGPDAATCAVIAATVAPLAAGDAARYGELAAQLALLTGLMCIVASFLRLGVLADFLSKPILVGFLNGIAITIILGQLGKILGVTTTAEGAIPLLIELAAKAPEAHGPTLTLGLGAFAVFALSSRLLPSLPAAVAAMALCGLAVFALGLEAQGVKTLGHVPAGLPAPILPAFSMEALPGLLPAAAGLALVSFTSMMLASRAFASKNGYDVDPDRDLAALGAANIVAVLTRGFAISGADSRTAMADATGGRTHATGLFAAAAVGLVLVFFTAPLAHVPVAALGAVLVMAGVSLIDLATLRFIYTLDRTEAAISLLATLGVVGLGATEGILIAVVLALLRFVHITARPRVEVLGRVKGMPGFHAIARHPGAATPPGVVIFRFNGPLVFFNADHFRRSLLAAASGHDGTAEGVVVDLVPITEVDVTGLFTLKEVAAALAGRGIRIVAAGRQTEWRAWMAARGLAPENVAIYPTLRHAVKALTAVDEEVVLPDGASDTAGNLASRPDTT
ncbi:SulP family inorganic anion transporter [Xanthobacter sp. V2C-8]|uniref:SulP family inorganic anion transporter n=1 Tax=Xanthobacter albus TaxID=3119929 RepID=UPI00372CA653